MKEEFHKWHSPHLNREMKMLVFGHGGQPIILFPTTMGRYYENKDFLMMEAAKSFIENGSVQIYCPDSINELSWYNKEIHPSVKVHNHVCYDKMIQHEIVEKIRWNTASGKVAVAGPSFGGFHAANFAFRHPELVSHLLSMSGAFKINSFLDGYYDENVYFNNPIDYVPDLKHPDLWKMKIVLGTSEWDILKEDNVQFSQILHAKGIDHWLDMRGQIKHDWVMWRDMFPEYLSQMN